MQVQQAAFERAGLLLAKEEDTFGEQDSAPASPSALGKRRFEPAPAEGGRLPALRLAAEPEAKAEPEEALEPEPEEAETCWPESLSGTALLAAPPPQPNSEAGGGGGGEAKALGKGMRALAVAMGSGAC